MWTRACAQAGRVQCSAEVARQTSCELEADALAKDVLNRSEALCVPLEQATAEMQLVQSLAPLWAEERLRTAAAGLPPPRRATSPERGPPAAESEFVERARAALRCCTARCAARQCDACLLTTHTLHAAGMLLWRSWRSSRALSLAATWLRHLLRLRSACCRMSARGGRCLHARRLPTPLTSSESSSTPLAPRPSPPWMAHFLMFTHSTSTKQLWTS
jgi:hypothetical protein